MSQKDNDFLQLNLNSVCSDQLAALASSQLCTLKGLEETAADFQLYNKWLRRTLAWQRAFHSFWFTNWLQGSRHRPTHCLIHGRFHSFQWVYAADRTHTTPLGGWGVKSTFCSYLSIKHTDQISAVHVTAAWGSKSISRIKMKITYNKKTKQTLWEYTLFSYWNEN